MHVEVSEKLYIYEPTQEVIDWCEQELVITNPDYAKKERMGFWVGDTPKKLWLYEKYGNMLVLPFGMLSQLPILPFLTISFTTTFQKPIQVNYGGSDVPLYDYQKEAVDEAYESHFGIIQSAAGSGKTQMGIALVKRFNHRALWLTHTIDLLKQSKARAEQYMDPDMIGTITAGKVDIGEGITFATIQTMSRLNLDAYKDMWDVIIVDECHRVCGTPTAMTMFSKVLNSLAAPHKYGLSATVHRADGLIKATYALLGKVVHTVPDEALANKIMRVGIKTVETGIPVSTAFLNTDGTINYTKMITYLAKTQERNEVIVSNIEDGKSSLILSDRLGHLQTLMNTLPEEMRDKSVMISGKMTSKKGKEERQQAIEDMRSGNKKYLFATYSLAKEGLDIPCLERLYMATPVKDYAVVTQSIGRIARVCPGKADPVAVDFIDNIKYLIRAYKKRCTTYRKNNCYFVEA